MNPKSPIQSVLDHSKARREIRSKSNRIPSLPEVVTEVLRLLNTEGSEITEFEAVLSKDPALVAKMLRVVNSPFYGLARAMTSIQDAVMVLGFRSLRSLVLAASTANHMVQDYQCYGHEEKGLWKHALAVASGSRSLAKFLREGPDAREELFVAGLLHDIGKMLLAPYLTEIPRDEVGNSPDFLSIERDRLGITHMEAGELVCKKWGLTPLILGVVGGQSGSDEDATQDRHLAIVRLTNFFAHERAYGFREGFSPFQEDLQPHLEALGLSEEAWEEARFEMEEDMCSAISTLGNLGS